MNRRRQPFQGCALPAELPGHADTVIIANAIFLLFHFAPSCRQICAQFAYRNSLILMDEVATARRDNLNRGLGWTAVITAEAVKGLCSRWDIQPYGVADDACFARSGASRGSIADEFARGGVYFQPAKKTGRITGWQKMKRMLADAGKPDKPGPLRLTGL